MPKYRAEFAIEFDADSDEVAQSISHSVVVNTSKVVGDCASTSLSRIVERETTVGFGTSVEPR